MALENELKYYEEHKAEFLKEHESHFVVIKEADVLGFFPNEATAFEMGFKKYGNEPFLIKQVKKEEVVNTSPALFYGLINANP